jgi:SAM-dependent methyltransferase
MGYAGKSFRLSSLRPEGKMTETPPSSRSPLFNERGFDEEGYLKTYPDVAAAVASGQLRSGRHHYELYGRHEGRKVSYSGSISAMRLKKMARVTPLLQLHLPHERRGLKFDFLTKELRAETRIVDTDAVSTNPYDNVTESLIADHPNWLILDCGAGKRPIYYENTVNFEIVDYDTTDVIGVGEYLPFVDNSFDAVLSHAVLEHVRDPFKCAAEIARVLKRGGILLCSVPFLQPLHGYPHHYFNMTGQGLRRLFEDHLSIEKQTVPSYLTPVWWLTWALSSWVAGLDSTAEQEFKNMRVGDLLASPASYAERSWVRDLPEGKNFELAAGTFIQARKVG